VAGEEKEKERQKQNRQQSVTTKVGQRKSPWRESAKCIRTCRSLDGRRDADPQGADPTLVFEDVAERFQDATGIPLPTDDVALHPDLHDVGGGRYRAPDGCCFEKSSQVEFVE